MRKTTVNLTDDNYTKIKNHKKLLNKTSVGTITFGDSLNNLVEKAK